MLGAFLTWLFGQAAGLENSLGEVKVENGHFDRVLKASPMPKVLTFRHTDLAEDGFVLILIRCYCYSLALFYFCVSYRIREGLVRFQLHLRRPDEDAFQEIHMP